MHPGVGRVGFDAVHQLAAVNRTPGVGSGLVGAGGFTGFALGYQRFLFGTVRLFGLGFLRV